MNGIVSMSIIVAGLATGALYASSALCLSLTYRASRVLNLAQGSIALTAACVVARLHWLPAPLAAIVAVAVGSLIGLGLEATTRNPDPLGRLTSVIGWLLGLSGLQSIFFDDLDVRFPLGTGTVRVLGVALGFDQLTLIALALALPIALGALLERTGMGAQLIAVADAPDAARAIGLDVAGVRRLVWAASQGLVGVIGVLAAPTIGLEPITALKLLSGGLAAALVGGIDDLKGPVAVGFGLGMLGAVLGGHISPSLADALLVCLVLASLVVRRSAVGGPQEARV